MLRYLHAPVQPKTSSALSKLVELLLVELWVTPHSNTLQALLKAAAMTWWPTFCFLWAVATTKNYVAVFNPVPNKFLPNSINEIKTSGNRFKRSSASICKGIGNLRLVMASKFCLVAPLPTWSTRPVQSGCKIFQMQVWSELRRVAV